MELTHKRYLKITFPFMLSSVAVPVIGAVDTAVVGAGWVHLTILAL